MKRFLVIAIFVVGALSGCGSTGLSGTSSPSSTGRQAQPTTALPSGAPTAQPSLAPTAVHTTRPAGDARPLLIDTDVAPDDLVAIASLLGSPNVDIKAITVSGTGEAHCDGGVDVVLGLLERLAAPSIDVACGRETPIAGDHAFPDEWRAGADDGSGLALPSTSREPFSGTATKLLEETIEE